MKAGEEGDRLRAKTWRERARNRNRHGGPEWLEWRNGVEIGMRLMNRQERRPWNSRQEVLLEEAEGGRGRVSRKGALSEAVLSICSLNIL
jgi:hypothetical protein